MFELKGRSVLVTGASGGIGAATALAFAREGARVALVARRAEKLKQVGDKIRAEGGTAVEIAADVADRADALRAAKAAEKALGGVDVLVNNAGINDYLLFSKQRLEAVEDIVRVNFLGAAAMTYALLPGMLERRSGHVVNVASTAGLRGIPYSAAYSASKFALVGFTEALRVELRGSGVTLTAFCPGTVLTELAEKALAKDPALARSVRRAAKTPEQAAARIVRATRRREPEVVFGEVPGPILKLARLAPGFSDWLTHRIYRRYKSFFAGPEAP